MLNEITNKQEWNQRVLEGSAHRFLQSFEWGEFQSLENRVTRFADGNAYAQVEERSLPFGLKCWFIPQGPAHFTRAHFDELSAKAREAGAIFLRFEPANEPEVGSRSAAVDPAVTLVTDLTQNEEQLLAGMHSKTRYNIRLAEKKGVAIAESKDIDVWLKLHHETTARDKFRGHSDNYYRAMLACPIVKLFVASLDGVPLAAMIAIFYGDTATYLHGASSNQARDVMAPYALHWSVMREAKVLGCSRYDWWGMNPSDEKHPEYKKSWEGITRFKWGFGGTEVITPGTFELPTRPLWYKLYQLKRAIA